MHNNIYLFLVVVLRVPWVVWDLRCSCRGCGDAGPLGSAKRWWPKGAVGHWAPAQSAWLPCWLCDPRCDGHSTCQGRRCRAPSWDMWLDSVGSALPQSHQRQQDELRKEHWNCDHSMWGLSWFRNARTDESCFPRNLCLLESNPSPVKTLVSAFSLSFSLSYAQ